MRWRGPLNFREGARRIPTAYLAESTKFDPTRRSGKQDGHKNRRRPFGMTR